MHRQHPLRRVGRSSRRGATLVFVAILTVVLAGMGAFAVDAGRMYVGVSELQTVADAGALRGALRLQRAPGSNPSDSVIAFSGSNQALGGVVTFSGNDIEPVQWNETSKSVVTAGVSWTNATAVQVTARRAAPMFFGRVFTSVARVPVRRSVAWIANLSGSSCVKPWGLPMAAVLSLVGASPSPLRALTQAEVQLLRLKSVLDRTFVLALPKANSGKPPYKGPGATGNWVGLGDPGKPKYQAAIADNSCTNEPLALGTTHMEKPNTSIDKWTTEAVQSSMCGFVSGSDICYDRATKTIPGVKVLVAFTQSSEGNGKEDLSVDMLGEFVLLCYRQADKNATCSASTKISGAEWAKYDEGSMIGYVNPDFTMLGPGAQLGNTVSTAQRLILVR